MSPCESCGKTANVRLQDGSTWCWSCHGAALDLGYDRDTGTPLVHLVKVGRA